MTQLTNPTNEQELREQVSGVMYDTDYEHLIEEPDYFDKAAVDAVVELIQAHTNAEIAKVLDRLESTAVYAEYDKAEDDVICGDVVPLDAVQAERAKLKEVK